MTGSFRTTINTGLDGREVAIAIRAEHGKNVVARRNSGDSGRGSHALTEGSNGLDTKGSIFVWVAPGTRSR